MNFPILSLSSQKSYPKNFTTKISEFENKRDMLEFDYKKTRDEYNMSDITDESTIKIATYLVSIKWVYSRGLPSSFFFDLLPKNRSK